MTLILECMVICFILLIPCVIAIANGVEQAAFLFEKDVQNRVVQMGLVSWERLNRNRKVFKPATLTIMVAFVLVKQRHFEKDLFFEQMKSVCFLGEIGIDGSRRAMESLSEQIAFFDEVIHKASINNRNVLSIHSRGAVKEVLQTLESNNGNYVPVLHWFTGKIKEAEKAIELGCWFSINPKMCFTETGKKIIKCLPLDRILPETDAPFVQINGAPYMPWDTTVTSYLARENRLEFDYLNSLLHKNLDHIINLVQNN